MIINRTQLQEILIKAHQHARLQAKEAGASIYYIKDGKRIREDSLAGGLRLFLIKPETGKSLISMINPNRCPKMQQPISRSFPTPPAQTSSTPSLP